MRFARGQANIRGGGTTALTGRARESPLFLHVLQSKVMYTHTQTPLALSVHVVHKVKIYQPMVVVGFYVKSPQGETLTVENYGRGSIDKS